MNFKTRVLKIMIFPNDVKIPIALRIAIIMCFSIPKMYGLVSIVYNLRIAESTKQYSFKISDTPHSINILGFNHDRASRSNRHLNAGGILTTFAYTTPSFWARVDFALAKVQESQKNLCGKQTFLSSIFQTDDILFTAGYSFFLNKRSKIGLSGILGIPTHKDSSLIQPQFGIAHVGIGVQIDSAFLYSNTKKHTIRSAIRSIYLIPSKVFAKFDNILSIVNLHLGNLIDIFLSHNLVFDKHNFEYGIDQLFLVGTKIVPFNAEFAKGTPLIRSAFYSGYKYHFSLKKTPSILAIGFSYSIDSLPKEIGNKRLLTGWISLGISF